MKSKTNYFIVDNFNIETRLGCQIFLQRNGSSTTKIPDAITQYFYDVHLVMELLIDQFGDITTIIRYLTIPITHFKFNIGLLFCANSIQYDF